MKNSLSHRARGDIGEEIARDFLREKGLLFMEQNFCVKGGEIDLIFFDPKEKEIVFVEVKLRNSFTFGKASESITSKKIKHLVYSAQRYFAIHKKNWFSDPFRFDVVCIDLDIDNNETIDHIEHAFSFDDF